MKIGDKVRMISGTEEGHVVSFKDKNIVEVEIEDGFVIPVIKSDLVVVSSEEENYFGIRDTEVSIPEPTISQTRQKKTDEGIYLAFLPINENDLSLNLINDTKQDFLFNISEKKEELTKSLQHGTLGAGRNTFITYLKFDQFEKWPPLFIQIIKLYTQFNEGNNLLQYQSHFKAKSFIKSKQHIPSLGKEGYLISLQEKLTTVKAEEIKEKIFSDSSVTSKFNFDSEPFENHPIIDLHIEKLDDKHEVLSNEEMLDIQMKKFEKELEKAIIKGCQSIKFIHGVGNGTLRMKIHKKLSHSDAIKFFEDSDKEKFGFGATTVHL